MHAVDVEGDKVGNNLSYDSFFIKMPLFITTIIVINSSLKFPCIILILVCRDLWATYVHKRGSITIDLSETWSPIYTKTDLSTLLNNTKVGEIYTMVLQVSSECLQDVGIGLSGEDGWFKTNVPANSKNKVIVITDIWKGITGTTLETRSSCASKNLTIHEIELFKGKNRCLKSGLYSPFVPSYSTKFTLHNINS